MSCSQISWITVEYRRFREVRNLSSILVLVGVAQMILKKIKNVRYYAIRREIGWITKYAICRKLQCTDPKFKKVQKPRLTDRPLPGQTHKVTVLSKKLCSREDQKIIRSGELFNELERLNTDKFLVIRRRKYICCRATVTFFLIFLL